MEVDLSKPLVGKFRLSRKFQKIEYESTHTVCFNCGKYGHRKKACRVGDDDVSGGNGSPETSSPPVVERIDFDKEIAPNYGNWMLVQRQSRKHNTQQGKNSFGSKNQGEEKKGSRNSFDVLGSMGEENGNMEGASSSAAISKETLKNKNMVLYEPRDSKSAKDIHAKNGKNPSAKSSINGGQGKETSAPQVTSKALIFAKNGSTSKALSVPKLSLGAPIVKSNAVSKIPNVAAEKDYHVLVRGNNQDNLISKSSISNHSKLPPRLIGPVPIQVDGLQLSHYNNPLFPHQAASDDGEAMDIIAPSHDNIVQVDTCMESANEELSSSPNI
ncbi:hypothetical protein PTKIN_Ptkin13bG0279500 [Pterospermum kingtungense]